jgi:hypothetical protein
MSIGAPLHPGHWSLDSSTPEWKGPDPYLFNIGGSFGAFQGELHWTLDVYVRLHQHAYASFRRHDSKLEELAAELNSAAPVPPSDSEEYEAQMIGRSRRMDHLYAEEVDLERSVHAINRMFVVALWALSEQYLGRVFQHLVALRTGTPPESVLAPYRWDNFKSAYPAEGVQLETLQDYALANECRVLNNHIKHKPTVSDKLVLFAPFHGQLGKPLERIGIDPQRYLNGVANFLGSLIEKCNAIHS